MIEREEGERERERGRERNRVRERVCERAYAFVTRVCIGYSLGGVGVGQGDGEHTDILLCYKVSIEMWQPHQSYNTHTHTVSMT